MTTFVVIQNTDIDQDSPGTQPLFTALRDNPIAIAEADSSVDASLLPTVLLGTLTTTSGTSLTLSSLTLTNYKRLLLFFDGVGVTSVASGTDTIRVAGVDFIPNVDGSSAELFAAWLDIGLSSGRGLGTYANIASGAATGGVRSGSYGITNATTSVTIAVTGGAFDRGSVLFYGVK